MKKYICIRDLSQHEKGKVYEFGGFCNDFYFEEFEFKAGDIVSHVLYDGEFEINSIINGELYPIVIRGDVNSAFTISGKHNVDNDKPSIHFIRRPRLEVKETVEVVRYVNDENLRMIEKFSSSNIFMQDVEMGLCKNKIVITIEK